MFDLVQPCTPTRLRSVRILCCCSHSLGPLPHHYRCKIATAYGYFRNPFPNTYQGQQTYYRRARSANQLLVDVGRYSHLSTEDKEAIRMLTELLVALFPYGIPNAQ